LAAENHFCFFQVLYIFYNLCFAKVILERGAFMKDKLKTPLCDMLFSAVLSLEDISECYAFFEDICTVNEIKSMAQRFAVAKLLTDGETYCSISDKTGASTTTISRVNRALNYGSDGYKTVLSRMKNNNKNNIIEENE